LHIDEEGWLQHDVAGEYKYRAHADIGISLSMGDSSTAFAIAIAKLQVAKAITTAKWEGML
jgi:hypothetical protein